ncbi:MAG: ethanolamine ammonia-lyase reactivating factor EutA [Intestinimonas sp.]
MWPTAVYQQMAGDIFRYGDIGVLLGASHPANHPSAQAGHSSSEAAETIRATVVGAGTHTTGGERQYHTAMPKASCRSRISPS